MEEPFEYDTEGTPCALAVEHAFLAFPDALAERFPEAKPAIEMGLESYLAICLRGADATHLGHLAVLDARPMHADEEDVAALRIFAARAAAELERRRQAAALEASRVRVIEAADAERRRIGRDLHDGAQQRLMAVANFLTVARKHVGRSGAGAGRGGAGGGERGAAGARARAVSGRAGRAWAARGGRVAGGGMLGAGVVEMDELELPEPVALAAYFVVCEALANVTRYSRAERRGCARGR